MQLDIKALGAELAEVVKSQIGPIESRLKALEDRAPVPGPQGDQGQAGADGKDAPAVNEDALSQRIADSIKALLPGLVKEAVAEHLKANPPASGANGKDGADGKDGASVTLADVRPVLDEASKALRVEVLAEVDATLKAIPVPKDGADGKDGARGEAGEKGADGTGMAGAMIDREGSLLITMTNGEVKSLGRVVGTDGKNGDDGVSLDSFDLEYIAESHEIAIKAVCAGRVKEIRYSAGGIRPAGYWREGTKSKAGEAWVHEGSLWICVKDNAQKPDATSETWIIAARKGRDGERGQKGQDAAPPAPVKLKD